MTREQRVLARESQRSDLIFDEVGIHLDAAVLQEQRQPEPMVQKIGDGLSHLAAAGQARGLGAQKIFELGDERSRPLGANALPDRRLFASYLRLDCIERGDAREDRLGDGRARLRRGADDLAPSMAPTPGEPQRGAAFASRPRQSMIASIAVDLEDAVESFEYPLGMLAAAPRRVMIDHDRRIGAAMPAVVAQNGPEIARLRPAAAGVEHRGGRLVHEQTAGQLHQHAHALDERREVEGRRSHPIGQNGAVEHDPVAREDL